MMPAIAIPPIPILLAYSLNIISGDISLTAIVMFGFHVLRTWSPNTRANPGTMTNHTTREPAHMMAAYFRPTIYPNPSTAAPVFILKTNLNFSATISPALHMRLVKFSFHHPKVPTIKSYRPPMSPAIRSGFAWSPPFSPDTRTCVLAVASGKGYSPCLSFTKYLRNGMRKRIPNTPPSRELMNICMKFTVISGYFS